MRASCKFHPAGRQSGGWGTGKSSSLFWMKTSQRLDLLKCRREGSCESSSHSGYRTCSCCTYRPAEGGAVSQFLVRKSSDRGCGHEILTLLTRFWLLTQALVWGLCADIPGRTDWCARVFTCCWIWSSSVCWALCSEPQSPFWTAGDPIRRHHTCQVLVSLPSSIGKRRAAHLKSASSVWQNLGKWRNNLWLLVTFSSLKGINICFSATKQRQMFFFKIICLNLWLEFKKPTSFLFYLTVFTFTSCS